VQPEQIARIKLFSNASFVAGLATFAAARSSPRS